METRRQDTDNGERHPAYFEFGIEDVPVPSKTLPQFICQYDHMWGLRTCFVRLKAAAERRPDTEQIEQPWRNLHCRNATRFPLPISRNVQRRHLHPRGRLDR